MKNAIVELNQQVFTSNPKAFFKFIETFGTTSFQDNNSIFLGTHYVVSAVMGGKVAMETSIDKASSSLSDTTNTQQTQVSTQQVSELLIFL